MQSAADRFAAERAELDALLASGILGRTNYAVRLLTYVCEKYFEGDTEDVKEYNIAVHALGRSADFDPQVDTIVRVTAHTLRKRLEEYYRNEGADRAIHIAIPPGRYIPNFMRCLASPSENGQAIASGAVASSTALSTLDGNGVPSGIEHPTPENESSRDSRAPEHGKPRRVAGIVWSLAAVACVALMVFYLWPRFGHPPYGQTQAAAAAPPIGTSPTLRAIIGDGRKSYTDGAGFIWAADGYCSGGDSFSVSRSAIQGTADPELFEGGRSGLFQCRFPVPPGAYELHLLFAETAGLQENARAIGFAIDGGASNYLDVVDDAGSDETATAKVFANVQPESDGNIHLDFTMPHSFLNAVEILPDATRRPLPTLILAGRTLPYRDIEGRLWLPDRDYFGGRQSNHGSEVRGLPDSGIYDGQRIGHFHYSIPVAPGPKYTLKLHFIERWFGIENQNVGGAGSRVFDISCNGAMLAKNFDIMREAQNAPLVKTFLHIEPTPQAKIEIYFTPNVNYPAVSAIEILPE